MSIARELGPVGFRISATGSAGLDWQRYVRIDPALMRPAEVDHLIGDASKGRQRLGWTPSVTFEQLIGMMVDADVARLAPTARAAVR